MTAVIDWAEKGVIPDALLRWGMRRLAAKRLKEEDRGGPAPQAEALRALVESLRKSPVAIVPEKANEQHYEVPPEFFQLVLGKRLKYSSCYYPEGVSGLDAAEEAMLALYGERAELADGQHILELGCGWGSLTLWMAERFPKSRILGVSNSAPQREFILGRARELGLSNVEIQTQDMNVFDTDRRFDRVVSIEMFEHMRNYEELLSRVARWLKLGGKLFVHVFCHRTFAYPFEDKGSDDWMSRNFFTGGIMPSEGLFSQFQRDLELKRTWRVDGTHYQRTSEDWLANLDRRRPEVLEVLGRAYGRAEAGRWAQRWRMFFLACAEVFGFRGGAEWGVAHYLFERRETFPV